MVEFHNTMYGKRYYEHQLPELTKQLTRIADALEKSHIIPEPTIHPSDLITCHRCYGTGKAEDYLAFEGGAPKVTCIQCHGSGKIRFDEMPGYQKH